MIAVHGTVEWLHSCSSTARYFLSFVMDQGPVVGPAAVSRWVTYTECTWKSLRVNGPPARRSEELSKQGAVQCGEGQGIAWRSTETRSALSWIGIGERSAWRQELAHYVLTHVGTLHIL